MSGTETRPDTHGSTSRKAGEGDDDLSLVFKSPNFIVSKEENVSTSSLQALLKVTRFRSLSRPDQGDLRRLVDETWRRLETSMSRGSCRHAGDDTDSTTTRYRERHSNDGGRVFPGEYSVDLLGLVGGLEICE